VNPASRFRHAKRFTWLLLAASIAAPFSASGQDSPGHQARLALSASIENQEYCLLPDGRTNLRLSIRLEFRNISNRKVILYEKSNFVDAMDITDFASGHEPLRWPQIQIDRVIPAGNSAIPASPGEDYAFLKPGKTLRTNTVVHIDLLHSKLPGGGLVNPGKYSLAVSIVTWYGTYDGADAARQQWRRSGYLITGDVTSAPVSFSVSPNPQFHDCKWNE
jgi:hypothetical protein